MATTIKSVKSADHGKAVIATLKRDPVTGRLLPRTPGPAATPATPATEAPEVDAPAPTPFRGHALARHRQRSGS